MCRGKPLSSVFTVAFREGIVECWANNSVETNQLLCSDFLGLTDKIVQLLEASKRCEGAIYPHGIFR